MKGVKNYKRINSVFNVYTQDLTEIKERLKKDILKETLHVTKTFMRNALEQNRY